MDIFIYVPFVFSEYICHVFVRSDSLGGVIISDNEYPQRVVFTLLNKVSVPLSVGRDMFGVMFVLH